jgi:hypothetical protein
VHPALLRASADCDFGDVRWGLLWLQTLVLWALVAGTVRDRDASVRLVELLSPYAEYIVDGGMGVYGAVAHFVGEALAPFEPACARESFELALRIHERFEAPWYVEMTTAALAALG